MIALFGNIRYISFFLCLLFFGFNSSTIAQEKLGNMILPKGHVKNGTVDYTDFIQRYIDKNTNIVLPNFPILINDSGLSLKSNQTIIFQENTRLIMEASSKGKYAAFHLKNIENISIKGMRIIGDRDIHIGSSGEWGMGVEIINSKNVLLKDFKISKFWGDGIYISGSKTKNILIENGELNNNRRNGISIISGSEIYISNVHIKETKGTWPMSAIDIEPNSGVSDSLGKIVVKNVTSSNNPRGISIVLSKYLSADIKSVDINIENFISVQDEIGIKINPFIPKGDRSLTKGLSGKITFSDVTITEFTREPVMVKGENSEYELAPEFYFKNINVGSKYNLPYKFRQLNKRKFILN